MIELASYTHTEHGRWRLVCNVLTRTVLLERERQHINLIEGVSHSEYRWTTVKVLSADGPGRLGRWVESGFLISPNECLTALSIAVEQHLLDERIPSGIAGLGEEHSPPAGWGEKILAGIKARSTERVLSDATELIMDMMRVLNGRAGKPDSPEFEVARRLVSDRVIAFLTEVNKLERTR